VAWHLGSFTGETTRKPIQKPSVSQCGLWGNCGSLRFIFLSDPMRVAERHSSASDSYPPPRITRGCCVLGQLMKSCQLTFLPSNCLYQSGA